MKDLEDNIENLDLFDEEFDKEDVVNRYDDEEEYSSYDEEEDSISEYRTGDTLGQRIDVRTLINKKKLDPEDFLNYDNEKRKKKDFRLEYKQKKEIEEQEKRLQENFKDFLIARRISGKASLSQYKSRLPADILLDSGSTVQIEDEPDIKEHEEKDASKVVINRDENDMITNIVVYCSCGRKTKIEFDYDSFAKSDIEKEKQESILDYDRYIDNKEEMDIEFENKKELLKQKNMKDEDEKRVIKTPPQTQMYEDPIVDELDDVIDSKTSSNVVDSQDISGSEESDSEESKEEAEKNDDLS
jgi:hypothetical protein